MRRWLAFVVLAGTFAFPFAAQAQNPIKLSTLQVQLWPEYDQPSMLVIYDFKLPEDVKLPVSVSMSFPKEAHLVAVASQAPDGSLLTSAYRPRLPSHQAYSHWLVGTISCLGCDRHQVRLFRKAHRHTDRQFDICQKRSHKLPACWVDRIRARAALEVCSASEIVGLRREWNSKCPRRLHMPATFAWMCLQLLPAKSSWRAFYRPIVILSMF